MAAVFQEDLKNTSRQRVLAETALAATRISPERLVFFSAARRRADVAGAARLLQHPTLTGFDGLTPSRNRYPPKPDAQLVTVWLDGFSGLGPNCEQA